MSVELGQFYENEEAKFSRSTHEQLGAFNAKMNTTVRTTICHKIFCAKSIVFAYSND